MPATFYLFACALAVAQSAPADSSEWQLQPRLARGLELVYRGSFVEQDDGLGVGFRKTLHLEDRVFVLDVGTKGTEAAFFTLWKGAAPPGEKTPATAVRLETAHIDGDGRVRPPTGVNLTAALEGPPTAEVGMFVTAPGAWTGLDRTWEVAEPGRPPRRSPPRTESVAGIRCVRLVGTQQSDGWDRPMAGETVWERIDTVWLDPQTGYARKLERVVSRREPGRATPSQRWVLKYELESAMTYPNHLAEDRQREIQETMAFDATVVGLLPRAGQVGPRPFEAVLAKIHYHVDHDPPTPYREALLQVQRLAEAGRRGESPPELPAADPTPPITESAVVGKHAPDFLAAPIGEGAGVQLRTFVGRPVLLVFYNPTDSSADEVLRFAQRIRDVRRDEVTVLSLAVSEDAKRIQQQRDDLRLSLPVLSGTGLTLSYGVDATPKLLVLDGVGVVRGSYVGWGPEIPHSVQGDLDHCRTVPK